MSDEIKYEQALNRIEEIVTALENNDVSLDKALALFEEGTKLTAVCNKKIEAAKAKITEIDKEKN